MFVKTFLFALAFLAAGHSGVFTTTTRPPVVPSQNEAAPPAEHPDGTAAKIVEPGTLNGVLGKEVFSPSNENIGRIVDVLVDRDGHIRAAVIDFGGFLGVGSRKIAVDWSALHFTQKGSTSVVTVDLNRERLRVAPEVRQGEPVIIISGDRPSQTEAKAPE